MKKKRNTKTIVLRCVICLLTLILAVVTAASAFCLSVVYGHSESLRNMLVLSAKQASATKWIPQLFMSRAAVDAILAQSDQTNVEELDAEDYGTQEPDEWNGAVNGTKLIFLNEKNFKGYMLLIKDPSRVRVGVCSDNLASSAVGKNIFGMVEKYDAYAAVNGGEFNDENGMGKGGQPMGLTYAGGECVWDDGCRRTFIGLTNDNRLYCTESITKERADALGIRDGVSFQTGNVLIEEKDGKVKLHYRDGNNSTAQRTAVAQRADGTFIFLVTDGRSAESVGATRNEIIDLLVRYKAVSAGMLDGGSSAMLYVRNYIEDYGVDASMLDEYQLKGLVNRYKAFYKPRAIPTSFVVVGG